MTADGDLAWLNQRLDEVDGQAVSDTVAVLTALVIDVVCRRVPGAWAHLR